MKITGSSNILYLPFEIMLTVFQFLEYEDLMSVTEVCKEWFRIGTDPLLWKDFILVKKDHCLESLSKILKIPRLEKTRRMEIWGNFEHETIHQRDFLKNCFLSSEHVELMARSSLTQISFNNCILSQVEPSSLARLVG